MKKLMIVDDEIMVRIGMNNIIDWETYGYTIIAEASNGLEALNKMKNNVPDVVFTDIVMDEYDGFMLMEECKKLYPDMKFIIMSNFNDYENTRKAIRLGAVDYIFKLTVTPAELQKVLSHLDKTIALGEEKKDRLIEKNISAIKNNLVNKVIQGSNIGEQALKNEFAQLNLCNDFDMPFVVLQISIDEFKLNLAQGKLDNLYLIKYGIENLYRKTLESVVQAETYVISDSEIAGVINVAPDSDYAALIEWAEKIYVLVSEYVKRYFDLNITASLSSVYTGIFGLKIALQENEKVLSNRLSSANRKLHVPSEYTRDDIAIAKKYINEHISENISLHTVAGKINVSPSYFSYLFKKEVKMSYVEYVNKIRIKKACELLVCTNMKIKDIAFMVGIDNYNYFSILFKKYEGITPVQYRETHQK